MANPSLLSIIFTLFAFLLTHHVAAAAPLDKFDYIIAGGGTCGLLLANRLSEDAHIRVAVIEPGGDVRNNTNVTDPSKFTDVFGTLIDWAYPTVAQAGAANRTLTMHSGMALGGSSTINGMTYVRADAAEIDAWEALGSPGWTWERLLPYYKRVDGFTPPTEAQVLAGASYEPAYHGHDGDLHVGFRYTLPNGSFYSVVRDTWAKLGYARNVDVNSGDERGFDVWPQTVDRDRDLRWDAAQAFYYPIDGRPNLHVIRGTVVKILWSDQDGDDCEEKVATGVQYVDSNGTICTATAEKEVINVTADPATASEWVEYITHNFSPTFHPVGTAAMMARELGGVVDAELRVYGAANVRVVDASIFPLQVSGHPTSTLYAVAERTSDMIRGRALL